MDDGHPAGDYGQGSGVAGYQIEARIGRGGMATVFRARDPRLSRIVALKILAPQLAWDEAFRARFIRESRAAAATDHPHIIPVYEAGEADGVLFIAMRFVRGGDLRRQLSRAGQLPPEMVANIVSQTASALDTAHKLGLVHRDVKPGNLLVDVGDETGRPDHVYLSDFGLSKDSMSASSRTSLTVAGQVLGTLDYMAPEQVDGRLIDGRADQYGLACTAYELLCGMPPFGQRPQVALMRAHRMDQPPPITSRRDDLPRPADAIFTKALAKAPDDRYRSCSDFAEALRGALGLPPYGPGANVSRARLPTAMPGALPTVSPQPPHTPPGGQGYPSTAPTILKGNTAPPTWMYAERTEAENNRPPASVVPSARPGRRWFTWRGRRRGRTGGPAD